MKTRMLVLLSFVTIFMTGITLAWDVNCTGNNCGPASCNPYESHCQCTDPSCDNPWDSNCISRAECCEAFGNIGAR